MLYYFHVIDFCDKKETRFGMWSLWSSKACGLQKQEQAFGSVHSDFAHVWQKYKMPTHETFSQRLLRSVQEYNGNNFDILYHFEVRIKFFQFPLLGSVQS